MSTISPVKKTAMRTSHISATTKATNATPLKTPAKNFLANNKVQEIPLEPNARYTISYVPGMSEHE